MYQHVFLVRSLIPSNMSLKLQLQPELELQVEPQEKHTTCQNGSYPQEKSDQTRARGVAQTAVMENLLLFCASMTQVRNDCGAKFHHMSCLQRHGEYDNLQEWEKPPRFVVLTKHFLFSSASWDSIGIATPHGNYGDA